MRVAATGLAGGMAVLGALMAANGAGAQTTGVSAVSLTYDVIAKGVTASEAGYTFTFRGNSYSANSYRRATGIVRGLVGKDQDFTYASQGDIVDQDSLRARSYTHRGGNRDRTVRVTFGGPEGASVTATPAMGMGRPPATAAQKQGTMDQVAMMGQMILATGDPCRQPAIRVFMDGRSRFDVGFSPNGTQRVNIAGFRGEAVRCSVRFQPISGWPDPIDPATLTFLFAPVNGVFVPLQIQMPTADAGVVRLVARRFQVTGTRG